MKKILMSAIIAVLFNITLAAQNKYPDYYSNTKTVKGDKITFIVKSDTSFHSLLYFSIYNSLNIYDSDKQFHRADGTRYFPGAYIDDEIFKKAFYGTFSIERAKLLFNSIEGAMWITYIIDSQTGKTLEVYFSLRYYKEDKEHTVFSMTPLELETFEMNIKKFMIWQVPEDFKEAEYCIMSHSVGVLEEDEESDDE